MLPITNVRKINTQQNLYVKDRVQHNTNMKYLDFKLLSTRVKKKIRWYSVIERGVDLIYTHTILHTVHLLDLGVRQVVVQPPVVHVFPGFFFGGGGLIFNSLQNLNRLHVHGHVK